MLNHLSLQELRSFIGLVNCQRTHVKNFASLIFPLQRVDRKNADVKQEWNLECEAAFAAILAALLQAPLLGQPDYGQMFKLFSDAS